MSHDPNSLPPRRRAAALFLGWAARAGVVVAALLLAAASLVTTTPVTMTLPVRRIPGGQLLMEREHPRMRGTDSTAGEGGRSAATSADETPLPEPRRGRRRARPLRLFVEAGLDPAALRRALQRRGLTAEPTPRRDDADVIVRGATEATGRPAVTTAPSEAVRRAIPTLLLPPGSALEASVHSLVAGGRELFLLPPPRRLEPRTGAHRSYAPEPEKPPQAETAAAYTGRGTELVTARMVPAMAVVGAGTRQRFDLQVRGRDGAWRSASARPETLIRLAEPDPGLIAQRGARGVFCSPATTSAAEDGQRVLVEGRFNVRGGAPLVAYALVELRTGG